MAASLSALQSVDDIRMFIAEGYRASQGLNRRTRSRGPLEYGFEWGRLPLSVAEPGPLIEHAVRLSGEDGITLQELRGIFVSLGKDRFERGLRFARDAGLLEECREKRPNRRGHDQQQVVLRANHDSRESGIGVRPDNPGPETDA